MTRIVVGHRDGAVALAQARSIVADLASEWPDISITQRTIAPAAPAEATAALIDALKRNQLAIALVSLERLPVTLPEEVTLAAVTRRNEARSALLAKGVKDVSSLAAGTVIGVPGPRDAGFVAALAAGLEPVSLDDSVDSSLRRLAEGEYGALILPASALIDMDRRSVVEQLLDPEVFPPAAGQGSLGLLVREQDDAAFELAYTLQHRPSFDRVRSERAFTAALSGSDQVAKQGGVRTIGALATVTSDGELSLFGAVISKGGMMLQATTTGEASEAEDIGRELAQDFIQQLAAL